MKKHLLFLGSILLGAASAFAQSPYTGAELPAEGGTFYLYNVETGMWLQNNDRLTNAWQTRAELGTRGLDVLLRLDAESGGEGSYKIDLNFLSNRSMASGQTPESDIPNLDAQPLYLDTDANSDWVFFPVDESNPAAGYQILSMRDGVTYVLMAKQYETNPYQANNLFYQNVTGPQTYICTTPFEQTTGNDLGDVWQLVTKEERLAKMLASTEPVDATWLVSSPDFSNNDRRYGAWKIDSPHCVRGGDEGNDISRGNMHIESWNSSKFHMWQEVEVPNGRYSLQVQGFYRDGCSAPHDHHGNAATVESKRTDGTETIRAFYYANDAKAPLMSILDGASDEQIPNHFGHSEYGSLWYPDNMQAASRAFNRYCGYVNDPIEVNVTDGILKIGIIKESNDGVEDDWINFDNFKVTYLGAADVSAFKENLQAAIDRAEAFTGAHTTATKAAFDAALTAAKAALSSTSEEVIGDATNALNSILNVVENNQGVIKALPINIAAAKAENVNGLATLTAAIEAAELVEKESLNAEDMKNAMNNLLLPRRINAIGTHEDKFAGQAPAEGDFYLYNVGRKQFLKGAMNHITHCGVGFTAKPVTLHAVEGGGGYKINTHLPNGQEGVNDFMNYNGYMDCPDGDVWTFVPTSSGDGIYNIARAADNSMLLGYRDGTYATVDTDMNDGSNPYNQWKLVTVADRYALLADASAQNPVDATFMVKRPSFDPQDANDAWVDNSDGNHGIGRHYNSDWGPDYAYGLYESWNQTSMGLAQDIVGLPAGFYTVSIQGYFRDGGVDNYVNKLVNGEEVQSLAVLEVNGEATELAQLHTEASKASTIGKNTAIGYLPDGCNDAGKFFELGLYKNSIEVEVGEDGYLGIMIYKDGMEADGSWVVLDNVRLTYTGETSGINSVEKNEVKGNNKVYNLQGIEVKEATIPGIYIKNGQKFIVK